MSSFLPNIFSAVLGDAASLAGLPMQAVAGALGGEILDRLLKTRRERATEIMLEALKRGTTRVHPDDLEESVSVLYRYLRAAEEGAARRNLRLLADVFAGQVRGKAVAADEFLYQAVEIPRPIRHDIATLIPRREDRMRGADSYNESLFSTVRLEEFVPQTHPLRPIRTWVNEALSKMDAKFSAMYEADIKGGRPSIAPEKLMRAMLLQVLYSIRSERQLVEQISYNLLFRWFVGLSIEDTVWNHSVFTKNRDRLIEFDAVTDLFNATVETAHKRGLLSGEHFSVDGTLIHAWASHKSIRRKDGGDDDRPSGNWRGESRSNETHQSKSDGESRLYRKSNAAPALPSYLGHVLTDNRHGLVVNVQASTANGRAERQVAADMLREVSGSDVRITVGADKAYDTRGFVKACREYNVTPHVARNTKRAGGSAIDGRTTRHLGYVLSQRKRKCIEQCFGWGKRIGPIRQVMVRGLEKVDQLLTLTMAAYNLTRLRTLGFVHPAGA